MNEADNNKLVEGVHYFLTYSPLYGVPLRVFPVEKYAVEFYSIPGCDGVAFVNTMELNGEKEICVVFKDAVNHYSTSVICHEVIHAAWRVLDIVGIKVSFSNHEALAYLADWMFTFIQDSLLPAAQQAKISYAK